MVDTTFSFFIKIITFTYLTIEYIYILIRIQTKQSMTVSFNWFINDRSGTSKVQVQIVPFLILSKKNKIFDTVTRVICINY